MSRPLLRDLGLRPYSETLRQMRARVDAPDFREEIWTLEHPPVHTLGQSAVRDDILNPGPVPVVQSDRGGRATHHAPGQALAYLLLDLRARNLPPRKLVALLESAVVALLKNNFALVARTIPARPGVYIGDAKIAALGLRIRRGRSYHGVSLNCHADLSPFADIKPCGCENLPVRNLSDFGVSETSEAIRKLLGATIADAVCDKFPL